MNEKVLKKLIYVNKYIKDSSSFFKNFESIIYDKNISSDLKLRKISVLYDEFKERIIKNGKNFK